jgi:hypothetical protein
VKKNIKNILWLTSALLFLVLVFTPDPVDLITGGVPVIELFALMASTIIYLSGAGGNR